VRLATTIFIVFALVESVMVPDVRLLVIFVWLAGALFTENVIGDVVLRDNVNNAVAFKGLARKLNPAPVRKYVGMRLHVVSPQPGGDAITSLGQAHGF
jgi:hypothetical protein